MNRAKGEAVNTNVMKLVKTDAELTDELRALVDAMVEKAKECHTRGMVLTLGFSNGQGDTPVQLNIFKVDKSMADYQSEEFKKAVAQQGARR